MEYHVDGQLLNYPGIGDTSKPLIQTKSYNLYIWVGIQGDRKRYMVKQIPAFFRTTQSFEKMQDQVADIYRKAKIVGIL